MHADITRDALVEKMARAMLKLPRPADEADVLDMARAALAAIREAVQLDDWKLTADFVSGDSDGDKVAALLRALAEGDADER